MEKHNNKYSSGEKKYLDLRMRRKQMDPKRFIESNYVDTLYSIYTIPLCVGCCCCCSYESHTKVKLISPHPRRVYRANSPAKVLGMPRFSLSFLFYSRIDYSMHGFPKQTCTKNLIFVYRALELSAQ